VHHVSPTLNSLLKLYHQNSKMYLRNTIGTVICSRYPMLDLDTPRYFDYKTDSSSIGVGILSWIFSESPVHMDLTQSQRVAIVLECVLVES